MTTIRPQSIDVDEEDLTAWVSAGVMIWDLMQYLGHYVTPSAPRGYALGESTFNVNVTIVGAIATGTHGSSVMHSSLSQQVAGFRVVLANGTSVEILPETHPFLFRAFQVNVGRLGIVTEVKMHIIPERLVKRTFRIGISPDEVLLMLRDAQETYKTTNALPDELDGMSLVWSPVDATFSVYTLEEAMASEPSPEVDDDLDGGLEELAEESMAFLGMLEDGRINAPINLSRSIPGGDVADGVSWQSPVPLEPDLAFINPNHTALVVGATIDVLSALLGNATLETHLASLSVPPPLIQDMLLLDDYEVTVPVDKMADCLEGMLEMIQNEIPDNGLRSILLFRFTGAEDGLLSPSYGRPHLWFDLPEYVYYNQEMRSSNLPFKRLMAFAVTSPLCAPARLHWGKAGFPDSGCWNGVEDYPETWCDFGCAVRALDPEGKFIGADPNLWNWEGANLDVCCSESGYDTTVEGCSCSVVPVRSPEDCPDPPFYTDR